MFKLINKYLMFAVLLLSVVPTAQADEVGCVSTTWRVVNNDKVCVQAFKDPEIDGVVCHLSYAKTGGVSGALGFAENPSRFSLACSQVGPLKASKGLSPRKEKVFTQKMSFLFKGLNVHRLIDRENNTIVYLVISEKIIDGSPFNSISTVPIRAWSGQEPMLIFNDK